MTMQAARRTFNRILAAYEVLVSSLGELGLPSVSNLKNRGFDFLRVLGRRRQVAAREIPDFDREIVGRGGDSAAVATELGAMHSSGMPRQLTQHFARLVIPDSRQPIVPVGDDDPGPLRME